MAAKKHRCAIKAVKAVVGKAKARRFASVMKPEYLAEIDRCRDAEQMYFDILKRQVNKFKNSEEGRHAMCKAFERVAERNKTEGIAEGKRETMLATAKRLIANGKLMLKEIAECSGLSLAQVKKLQASMA